MGGIFYPASRVSFNLPRQIRKRKDTLQAASRFPIKHAPTANVSLNQPRCQNMIIYIDVSALKVLPLMSSINMRARSDFDPCKFNREFVRCLQLSSYSGYQSHATLSAKKNYNWRRAGRVFSQQPFAYMNDSEIIFKQIYTWINYFCTYLSWGYETNKT